MLCTSLETVKESKYVLLQGVYSCYCRTGVPGVLLDAPSWWILFEKDDISWECQYNAGP